MRFQRVACAQRAGFKNREKWHHTDIADAKAHPERFIESVGSWINMHNPEDYVDKNYQKALNHVERGTSFQSTNIPPGYTYTPWTIDELWKAAAEERETVDEGDWS